MPADQPHQALPGPGSTPGPLWYWEDCSELDPFDPHNFDFNRKCRIYDVDGERYAVVNEKYYSQLVTMPARPASKRQKSRSRHGRLRPRLWVIKPPHPRRRGSKKYFVSNAGWRSGRSPFLHVEVMRLAKKRRPSKLHKLVEHKDGNEWNCTEENLKWVTPAQNRRTARRRVWYG